MTVASSFLSMSKRTRTTHTRKSIILHSRRCGRAKCLSKRRLKEEFYHSDDDHFVAELAYWLDIHMNGAKCPLFPVDLYWAGIDEVSAFDYQDDPEEFVFCGRTWSKAGENFRPGNDDWHVGTFSEGILYMNNVDGYMVLIRPNIGIFVSRI